jgi:hypothetical protein
VRAGTVPNRVRKLFEVGRTHGLPSEHSSEVVEEGRAAGIARIREAIEHPIAVSPVEHQSRAFEVVQMAETFD